MPKKITHTTASSDSFIFEWSSTITGFDLFDTPFVFEGSSAVDSIWIGDNASIDVTDSKEGSDNFYLQSYLGEYNQSIVGSTYTLKHKLNLNESITFSGNSGDRVYFSDGSMILDTFSTQNSAGVYQTLSAEMFTGSPTPAYTSVSPYIATNTGSTVIQVNDSDGFTVPLGTVGQNLTIVGGAGVERVHVSNYQTVNMVQAALGSDVAYLYDKFANYDQTIVGTNYVFTHQSRTNEQLSISANSNDQIYFTDGNITLSTDLLNADYTYQIITADMLSPEGTAANIQKIAIGSIAVINGAFDVNSDQVLIEVHFNNAIDIDTAKGSPILSFTMGNNITTATYNYTENKVNNTESLYFNLNRPQGEAALIRLSSIDLNKATIVKHNGTSAEVLNTEFVGHKIENFELDNTRPSLVITDNKDQPTASANSVTFSLAFNEDIIGFTQSDITVNATLNDFTQVNPRLWTATVTPYNTTDDTITLSVAENVATDLAGNGNYSVNATQSIDLNAVATPILSLEIATENGITTSQRVNVILHNPYSWQYSTDNGFSWTQGGFDDSHFMLNNEQTYQAGYVQVIETLFDSGMLEDSPAGTLSETFTVNYAAPAAISVTLDEDRGIVGDLVTSNGQFHVSGMNPNADFEYSTDAGKHWTRVVDSDTFNLVDGFYFKTEIMVRQIDDFGTQGEITKFGRTVTYNDSAYNATLTNNLVGLPQADQLVTYTFTFDDPYYTYDKIATFNEFDINITNGSKYDFAQTSDNSYQLRVSPKAGINGNMVVSIAPDSVFDSAGAAYVLSKTQSIQTADPYLNITSTDKWNVVNSQQTLVYTLTFNELIHFAGNSTILTEDYLRVVSGGSNITSRIESITGIRPGVQYEVVVIAPEDSTQSVALTFDATVFDALEFAADINKTSTHYNINTTAPNVVITHDNESERLQLGEDITYTFTFDEAVEGFEVGDIMFHDGVDTAVLTEPNEDGVDTSDSTEPELNELVQISDSVYTLTHAMGDHLESSALLISIEAGAVTSLDDGQKNPTTQISFDADVLNNGTYFYQNTTRGDLAVGYANDTGDFNGDGITDYIVSAPYADSDYGKREDAGVVYVIFGDEDADSYRPFDLERPLMGERGFAIHGSQGVGIPEDFTMDDASHSRLNQGMNPWGARASGDNLGFALANVGDVNGDGMDDILIGAPNYDSFRVRKFHRYEDERDLLRDEVIDLEDEDTNIQIYNDWGHLNSGGAYLIYGKADNDAIDLKETFKNFDGDEDDEILHKTDKGMLFTTDSYAHLGSSVAAAGDLNRDGYADFMIGSQNINKNNVYVVYGGQKNKDGSDITGNFSFDQVAKFNDNQDKRFMPLDGFVIRGDAIARLEDIGHSMEQVSDLNKDGMNELAIGVSGLRGNIGYRPEPLYIDGVNQVYSYTYLVYGQDDQKDIDIQNIMVAHKYGETAAEGRLIYESTPAYTLGSYDSYQDAPMIVTSAGDFNGDGLEDLLVSTPKARLEQIRANSDNPGIVYVIYGTHTDTGRSFDLATLKNGLGDTALGIMIVGLESWDSTGYAIHSAGDFNGDGIDDIIIGVPHADVGGNNSGAAYIIFGSLEQSGPIDLKAIQLEQDDHRGLMISGDNAGALVGYDVSSVGDFNNDGLADVVVSAHGENTEFDNEHDEMWFDLRDEGDTLDIRLEEFKSHENPGRSYIIYGVEGADQNIVLQSFNEYLADTSLSETPLTNDEYNEIQTDTLRDYAKFERTGHFASEDREQLNDYDRFYLGENLGQSEVDDEDKVQISEDTIMDRRSYEIGLDFFASDDVEEEIENLKEEHLENEEAIYFDVYGQEAPGVAPPDPYAAASEDVTVDAETGEIVVVATTMTYYKTSEDLAPGEAWDNEWMVLY